VWSQLEPLLGVDRTTAASSIVHYTLTEMVNNAIDHSGGTHVVVVVTSRGEDIEVTVLDDGVGAYAHLRDVLGLGELTDALLELSKGKRTTDPARHTGEGVFFTSKAVGVFRLESNGIAWTVDNRRSDQAVGDSRITRGTRVRLTVSRTATRDVSDVFREFTDEDHRFYRSRTSVKLAQIGVLFVSRSEARRLLIGLEAFSEVELDFAGVDEVGQGFADEVFRVWQRSHVATRLTPVGMSPMVEFMVRRSMV
jgi:anti-sigma regulatory factor (Ser/Thr protein kinase)